MVEFETLEEKEVALPRGHLRVAVARATSEKGTTEFLSIRKFGENNKVKQLITIPRNAEVVDALTDVLKGLAEQAPSSYLCKIFEHSKQTRG